MLSATPSEDPTAPAKKPPVNDAAFIAGEFASDSPNPYYQPVTSYEVDFLKRLQREVIGNSLRLWWEPAAKRGAAEPLVPTHVTIVSDQKATKDFAVAQLLAFRADPDAALEALTAPKPKAG